MVRTVAFRAPRVRQLVQCLPTVYGGLSESMIGQAWSCPPCAMFENLPRWRSTHSPRRFETTQNMSKNLRCLVKYPGPASRRAQEHPKILAQRRESRKPTRRQRTRPSKTSRKETSGHKGKTHQLIGEKIKFGLGDKFDVKHIVSAVEKDK
jgi:hypothetical protein